MLAIAYSFGKFFTYVAKTLANLTYPHKEKNRELQWHHFFEIDVVKSLTQSIKNLCQLDFFTKSLTILFVLIYSELRVLWVQKKRSDILVLLWQKCQFFKVYYLWLKKSITKVNVLLVIGELMASFGKVLRSFGDIYYCVCYDFLWIIFSKSVFY